MQTEKIVGSRMLARLKMSLTKQTSCRLSDGTIGALSPKGRVTLYTPNGRRINRHLGSVK